MSTTASGYAQELDDLAARARVVANTFHGAELRVLWDDGPLVYVASDVGADRIDIQCVDKHPRIFLYVGIPGDDYGRVYEDQRWPKSARVILDDLRQCMPSAYGAIVEAVKR